MKKNQVEYLIGTSGWNYDSWRGPFYPEDLAKSRWLDFYVTQFPTVEINATFYRFFKDETFIKWRDQAPRGFKFVLKAPRLITHYKMLQNCEETIKRFAESAALMGNKCSLILLQLSPHMPYDPERLYQAIKLFPHPKKLVVEFRDDKWHTPEIKELLTKLKCIYCATDSPDGRPLDWLTSNIGYLRMHGRKRWYAYNYSTKELQETARYLHKLTRQGAKQIYIFFNNDYEAYAIDNAFYLAQKL